MKRNVLFALLSFLFISGNAFAATKPDPIVGLKKPTFAPVPWHGTVENGGFTLQNQTNKIQYVQISIERGEILVLTTSLQGVGSCRKDLDADHGPFSVVCQLAPNETLSGDIDFSKMKDASGTYQVEMDT